MAVVGHQQENRDELDGRFLLNFELDWEIGAYLALVAIACLLRFWDLGTRMLHHDESLHATYSYYLYAGRGYKHDPMMHGPFLFELNALVMFLIGVSDATVRVAPALFGSALVAMPYFLRRYLGRSGALVAALLLTVSPSFLYFSRFLRHDIYIVVWTLALVILMLKYFEQKKSLYLYLLAAVLSLSFSTKEDTYITLAIFGTYLLATSGLDFLNIFRSKATFTPQTDVMILFGTFLLPLTAGLAAVGDKYLKLAPQSGAETTFLMAVFLALFSLAAVIGLRWNARVWLTSAAIFWGIFFTLYTTFFGNPDGFETGTVGALQYWLAQQGVARGDQPWYYYLVLLPIYEFLPIIFAIGGVVYFAWKRRDLGRYLAVLVFTSVVLYGWVFDKLPWTALRWLPILALLAGIVFFARKGNDGEVSDLETSGPAARGLETLGPETPHRGVSAKVNSFDFPSFLLYWIAGSMVLYGWASEKMPWMDIHMALPIVLLASIAIGRLIDSPALRRALGSSNLTRAGAFSGLAIIGFAVLYSLVGRLQLPPGGTPILRQQQMLQNLALVLLLAGIVFGLGYLGKRIGGRASLQISALVASLVLLVLTVHAAYMVTYLNGDVPVEMMVYTQTSPDVGLVMKEIQRVGFRTGQGQNLKVAYDSDVSWPFEWYLRDYKNRNFYGDGMPAADAPVVLVGLDNNHDAQVKPSLGNYIGQRYKLRWWFPEDYRNMTFQRIWQGVTDPTVRTELWDFFLYRKPFDQLGSTDFMLYVRKDLAEGPWATKSGATPAAAAQAQPAVDSYAASVKQIAGAQAWGSKGVGTGQLQDPKAVASAPDGSTYVLDTGNDRVEKFDANGNFVLAWGKKGQADGEFSEPWGIAVNSEGQVYVADTWNHRIEKFDANGVFLAKWGQYGPSANAQAAPYSFFGPRGIAIDAKGFVYVTDTGNARVEKFDANGKFIAAAGPRGGALGQFDEPVGIGVDSAGDVYVADTWNRRIQKLDANLKPLAQWSVAGWASNSVVDKPYIAVDAQGDVFTTDPEADRILEFSSQGAILGVWGKYGGDLASLQLPTGLAIDSSGRLLVADSLNNRVLRFAPK